MAVAVVVAVAVAMEVAVVLAREVAVTMATVATVALSLLSAPPTESMILSALIGRVVTLTVAATKKTTIGDTDDCGLTTLVNSASTAPLIGLPPKGAKFCHTLDILLVGCLCRRALWWLYFNFSVVGRLVGLWSTIRVAGLWEVSLQKENIIVPFFVCIFLHHTQAVAQGTLSHTRILAIGMSAF